MLLSAASFTLTMLLVRALGTMGAGNIWLITGARFLVGLVLITLIYPREFQPTHLWLNPRLIERGVVGSIGTYLMYLCVVKLGAGRASFIGNTYVIWGALLAVWLLRERLHAGLVAGSIIALTGLGLLTNIFVLTTGPGFYDLVAIGTALMSAWVVVMIRRLHATEHTATIFAAQCVYGLVLCAGPAVLSYRPLSPAIWLVMLLAGGTAGMGQLAMTRAFRDLPVAEGSLIQMLVPLGIAIGGMVFFGEHFSPHEMLGAALILGGTVYNAVRSGTPARPAPE